MVMQQMIWLYLGDIKDWTCDTCMGSPFYGPSDFKVYVALVLNNIILQ